MFETKILTDARSPEQLSALEQQDLRAFDWPELVARIAATNDLRRVVKASGGSFGGFTALAGELQETLQDGPQSTSAQNGKHAVYPNALEAGKTPSPIAVVNDKHTNFGDRKQA